LVRTLTALARLIRAATTATRLIRAVTTTAAGLIGTAGTITATRTLAWLPIATPLWWSVGSISIGTVGSAVWAASVKAHRCKR